MRLVPWWGDHVTTRGRIIASLRVMSIHLSGRRGYSRGSLTAASWVHRGLSVVKINENGYTREIVTITRIYRTSNQAVLRHQVLLVVSTITVNSDMHLRAPPYKVGRHTVTSSSIFILLHIQ